ncbi:MAG: SDR family oxidoreductase [Gemmatimonadetes bacterium]|nr:SDR family oxidoreductase [Gemmatimonadota bacterium]NNM03465.1 SDR family oxidoreductase [Gemmatimonadota bacterium]
MTKTGKTVLITGASTGIGKATALTLDANGYKVFAGVRKEADGQALKEEASDALTPLLLDITDDDAIAGAAARVGEETGGKLSGLVNNAGMSLNGPLELTPVSEIRKLFEVNVVGLLALTRSFIPLLREAPGRLINISSGHGLLAIPDKSVYAASKFAVQAISDSLRLELRPFGIAVSNLVVGKVDTAVLGKILEERERLAMAADPDVLELYSTLFEFFDKEVKNLPGIPPEEVAKVIAEALSTPKPKAQYLVGPGARKMKNLSRLPRKLREGLMYKALYGGRRS